MTKHTKESNGAVPPEAKAKQSEPPIAHTHSVDMLQQKGERFLSLIQQAHELLKEMTIALPNDMRKRSDGKLRDGEATVLRSILDAAKTREALLSGLADKDEGVDPSKFEIALLRERLDRRDLYYRLAQEAAVLMNSMTTRLSDSALYEGGRARTPALAAYQVLKMHAQYDVALQTSLADALSYYAKAPQRAAKVRAARKKQADMAAGNK